MRKQVPVIPEVIRDERKKRNLTQEKLAEMISDELGDVITYQTISHWECGRHNPEPEHLRALAHALNVPESCFLVGGDRPAAEQYVKTREDVERQRLRRLGFLPGFFDFLEGKYNCRIETLGAWIRADTGEFGVAPDDDLEISFDNTYSIQQSATGASLVNGIREDQKRSIFPESFEDDAMDPAEDAAVFHFSGRREDCALPLSELLELQNMLGRFVRAFVDEKIEHARPKK